MTGWLDLFAKCTPNNHNPLEAIGPGGQTAALGPNWSIANDSKPSTMLMATPA